jgi:hypothetical protein
LTGSLRTLSTDRVLEGGIEDKTELGDCFGDLAAASRPLLGPVKM